MRTRSRRIYASYLLVMVVAICALLVRIHYVKGATLILRNDTDLPMTGVSVGLVGFGKPRDLGNLAPGARVRVNFKNHGDSGWLIRIRDHGGAPLVEQEGYLTHGLNYLDSWTFGGSGGRNFDSRSWLLVPPPSALLP